MNIHGVLRVQCLQLIEVNNGEIASSRSKSAKDTYGANTPPPSVSLKHGIGLTVVLVIPGDFPNFSRKSHTVSFWVDRWCDSLVEKLIWVLCSHVPILRCAANSSVVIAEITRTLSDFSPMCELCRSRQSKQMWNAGDCREEGELVVGSK